MFEAPGLESDSRVTVEHITDRADADGSHNYTLTYR